MLKHKRIILIVFAVLFLVALFLIQRTSIFRNTISFVKNKQEGLAYDTKIEDLVNKDTDRDGILDWEEPLYGLDPTKKETTPGIPDISVLNKLKLEQENNTGTTNGNSLGAESLTQTDKFSRELFSTIASLNQSGVMDQATADQISSSLSNQIQNSTPRKVFSLLDIKLDPSQTAKNYDNALTGIFEKNKMPDYTVMDVLQRFIIDENNVDPSALIALGSIIESLNKRIEAIIKIRVPQSFAFAHLDFLNGLERIMENLSDIRLYDTDPILSLSGISQYENNSALFISANKNLLDKINQK